MVLRLVLQLAALRLRSNDFKELEIVLLRHELAILRRRTRCPAMTWTDRLFLTAASRLLPRARWRSFESVQGEERVQRETGVREISTKSPGLLQFGGRLRAL
jgi:hypothetical protein